jgi:hypothetical protein
MSCCDIDGGEKIWVGDVGFSAWKISYDEMQHTSSVLYDSGMKEKQIDFEDFSQQLHF